MSLREACKHGRWDEEHLMDEPDSEGYRQNCPGGRILSDAEALRALLFETCGECDGRAETFKPLGTMAHNEASPHYLTPAEGFWKGERLPPGRYRVGDDQDVWIEFDLLGEGDVLTNAVYLPEVEHWPFGQTPLRIMWTCPTCGGSGQTPKDGVRVDPMAKDPNGPFVIVPASMLEGDNT